MRTLRQTAAFAALAMLIAGAGTGLAASGATMRFHGNGGKINGAEVYEWNPDQHGGLPVVVTSELQLTAPKAYQHLDSWRWGNPDGLAVDGDTIPFTQNTDIYARWAANSYTVTVNANGGTGGSCPGYTASSSPQTLTLSLPGFNGFTLSGWTVSGAEGGTPTVSGTTLTIPADVYGNLTLKANWKGKGYSVTVDANGGTGGSCPGYTASTSPQEKTITLPTRTGHKVSGWSVSGASGGDTPSASGTTLSIPAKVYGDLTLTPTWSANNYKVNFKGNDGNVSVASVTAKYGQPMPAISGSVSRTGYTFAGFWDATSGGVQYYDLKFASARPWDKTKETDLYAHWTANTYTVKFNGNGNSGGSTANEAMTYGTAKALTANGFTRTGYAFAGWAKGATGTKAYSDKQVVSNLTSTANGTFDLYALWTANTYTVKFNGNGNSGGSTANETMTYGTAKALTANGFTRTGYAFAGWAKSATGTKAYSDKQVVSNLTSTANETFDLYALWTAKTYKVTFDTNGGGTPSPASTNVTYDSTYGTLATCTRTGYTFAGWYTAASGGTRVSSATTVKITSAQTLYAHWTAKTYTVTFNANGGKGSMADMALVYDRSTNLTANAFKRTGYTFDGWATTKTGDVVYRDRASVKNLTTISGGTVTLYAHWTANTYTVTFARNGASGGSMSNQTLTYDQPANLDPNAFVWTGHTFTGWKGSDGKNYADGAPVSNLTTVANEQFTMTAQWTANDYTVTLDPDGGEGGDVSVQVVYDADMPDIAVPTRRGFAFLGYFATKDGNVMYYDANGKGVKQWNKSAATTLYAHWAPNTYTVCFDSFGGSGAMENQVFTYGQAQTLRPNTFVRKGSTFAGWKSSGVVYTDGQTVSNLTDRANAYVVLHARWQTQGDTPVMSDLSVAVGLTNLVLSAVNGEWLVSSNGGYSGACARSLDRGDTHLKMGLTTPGPGTMTFKYRVSGSVGIEAGLNASGYGDLTLVFDGFRTNIVKRTLSWGMTPLDTGWKDFTLELSGSGPHAVSWEYDSDWFNDYTRIDDVVWTPTDGPAPAEILEVPDQEDVRDRPPGAVVFIL